VDERDPPPAARTAARASCPAQAHTPDRQPRTAARSRAVPRSVFALRRSRRDPQRAGAARRSSPRSVARGRATPRPSARWLAPRRVLYADRRSRPAARPSRPRARRALARARATRRWPPCHAADDGARSPEPPQEPGPRRDTGRELRTACRRPGFCAHRSSCNGGNQNTPSRLPPDRHRAANHRARRTRRMTSFPMESALPAPPRSRPGSCRGTVWDNSRRSRAPSEQFARAAGATRDSWLHLAGLLTWVPLLGRVDLRTFDFFPGLDFSALCLSGLGLVCGKRSSKFAPALEDVTETVPPCSSTIFFTIAKPRPVPPALPMVTND